MAIRAKTRQRLIFLVVLLVIFAGLLAGLYVFQRSRSAAETARLRAEGMDFYTQVLKLEEEIESLYDTSDEDLLQEKLDQANDRRRSARDALIKFNFRSQEDAEVLTALSHIVLGIARPNGSHQFDAMKLLQRAHHLAPNDEQVSRDLLDLYVKLNRGSEANKLVTELRESYPEEAKLLKIHLSTLRELGQDQESLLLANTMLNRLETDHPAYLQAMRGKITALFKLNRPGEAAETSELYLTQFPTDLWAMIFSLDSRRALGESPQELLSWANSQAESHPNLPGINLLVSMALQYSNMPGPSVVMLELASTNMPEDEFLSQLIIQQLAVNGRYLRAAALLADLDTSRSNLTQRRIETRYLLLAADYNAVIARTDDVNAKNNYEDIEVIGMRALALLILGRDEQARPLIDALNERTTRPEALAWASALSATFLEKDLPLGTQIERLQTAISRRPDVPWFRHLLATFLVEAGELELAVEQWREAIVSAPGWSEPHIQAAQYLIQIERYVEAWPLAERALLLAPNSIAAAQTVIQSASHSIDMFPIDVQQKILALTDQVLEHRPNDPTALAARVRLISRLESPALAREEIRKRLAQSPPPSARAIELLFVVDRELNLGMSEELAKAIQDVQGNTPAATMAQAVSLMDEGKINEALEFFRTTMLDADGQRNPEWLIRYATLMESAQADSAIVVWKRLAETAPDSPRSLETILKSSIALQDAAFYRDTILQLRELTGPNGLSWKIAQARYILEYDRQPEALGLAKTMMQNVIQAAPNDAEPRMLLAEVARQTGDITTAIEQLHQALTLTNNDPAVALEIVNLYQSTGQFNRAGSLLRDLTSTVSPENGTLTIKAAAAYLRQGMTTQAIALLERSSGFSAYGNPVGLFLAQLYERHQEQGKALATYEKLLASPSPQIVQNAADYFARQGDFERANQTMAILDELDVDPALVAIIRADFVRLHGDPDEIKPILNQAIQESPQSFDLHLALLRYHLNANNPESFEVARQQALRAMPSESLWPSLRSMVEPWGQANALPQMQLLMRAAIDHPEHIDVLSSTASTLAQQVSETATKRTLAETVDHALRQAPSEELALAAVELWLEAGSTFRASELADTMSQQFGSIALAKLATRSYAALNQWSRVLETAKIWDLREGGGNPEAQAWIVSAAGRLGQGDPAMETRVLRRLQAEIANPNPNTSNIALMASALLSSGRTDAVGELFSDKVRQSPTWRVLWMDLIGSSMANMSMARRWIDRLEPSVDLTNVSESLMYALMLERLAKRFDQPELREKIQTAIETTRATHPDDPRLMMALAGTLKARGLPRQAEQLYRQLMTDYPTYVPAINNLAMLLSERKSDLNEALALAQNAARQMPQSAGIQDTLGTVLSRADRDEQAIVAFDRAIELDPEQIQWHLHRAEVLIKIGNPERVREEIRALNSMADQQRSLLTLEQQDQIRKLNQQAQSLY